MIRKLIVVFLIISLAGCASTVRGCRHTVSGVTGLDRTITLYAQDGSVIRQWKTRTVIETEGAVIQFDDERRKDVKLMGTIVVEEK